MNPKIFNSRNYKNSNYAPGDQRIKKIVDWVGRDKVVLDLGCLDGGIGALFIKNNNKVYGIDASEQAIITARQRGLDASIGDLESPLDYPSEMFDVVFAGEVIEHVYDIDQLLSQIYRILKKGGLFIVTTPNLASLGRRLLLLFNHNPHIEISFDDKAAGHIRYFVKNTLCDILKKHRFSIISFGSDVVNFDSKGRVRSFTLANFFPSLGQTLIVESKK